MSRVLAVRAHPAYWAFVLHRVSGVLLALFLPVHLYVLSLAIDDGQRLDGFLRWTDQPLVKLAESGLVALLALHLLGGLRILAFELTAWRAWQKTMAAVAVAVAIGAAVTFLLVAA